MFTQKSSRIIVFSSILLIIAAITVSANWHGLSLGLFATSEAAANSSEPVAAAMLPPTVQTVCSTGSPTFPTIAAAVADANINFPLGNVTYNVCAGHTETIAGTLTLNATGSLGSEIVFQKSGVGANPLITAYVGTATPGSAVQDGMFSMVGSDYVTINGIDLLDPNTTNPATMEYGYGMFKAANTNGAQNNTIKNCTITLSRNNNATGGTTSVDGSRGIQMINALDTAQTTALTGVTAPGSNSNNKFYSNTIQNVNIGMALIGFADTTPFANADTNNDVGGASAATGNIIKNFGGGAATNPAAGIRNLAQYGLNISWNTVNNNDGGGVNHATTLRGIYMNTAVGASETITNNTITLNSGATTSQMIPIDNVAGGTGVGNTVTISNNTITNCTYTTSTTGAFIGIQNTASAATLNINSNQFLNNATSATGTVTNTQILNSGVATTAVNINSNNFNGWTFNGTLAATYAGINSSANITTATLNINSNNFQGITYATTGTGAHTYISFSAGTNTSANVNSNTFTNLNVNTAGSVTFINKVTNSMTATGTLSISSNSIVTGFNKGTAGGTITFLTNGGGDSSPNGAVYTENGNNFSNVTATGVTAVLCWSDANGASSSNGPTKNITNNVFNNITTGAAQITGISFNFSGNNTLVSNNTLTNLTGGLILSLAAGTSNGGATETISNNTFSNFTAGGQINALQTGFGAVTTGNIIGNTITNLSSSAATANPIFPIIASGFGTTTNISKNKIGNIQSTGNALAGSALFGILAQTSGTTYNINNNLVGDLRLPANPAANNLQGISVGVLTAGTTVNVAYNTVWLNESTNAQAGFGSSAISVSTTPTVVMIDNIFVNTSLFNTTGLTVAYRRSDATLTTYGAASNNNDFYAGTPGANNLIFNDGTNSDQTLGAYQTRVTPLDSASITLSPFFTSTVASNAQFLHINTAVVTALDGGGIPVAGIADDYDGDLRNATTPDIGADEFIPAGGPTPTSTSTFTPTGTFTPTNTATNTATPTPTCANFNITYSENFDGVTAPALPAGWTGTITAGTDTVNWVTSAAGTPTPVADTAPNSVFINNPAIVTAKQLDSAPIAIGSGPARLSFQNNFTFESSTLPNTWDGGVLEISINGGAFADIITAGGSFVTGGYNASVNTGFSNPLAGRAAWGNTSAGFITSTVDLPAAAAGQNIVLRWRIGTDTSGSGSGWRIDTITISQCGPTPTATNTPAVSPTFTNTSTPTNTATATNTATSTPTPAPCDEYFDGVTAPALPSGWSVTTTALGASPTPTPWITSATSPDTSPNDATAPDIDHVSDNILTSRFIASTGAATQISFANLYNLEDSLTVGTGYDGMVLEISINGGAFADIVTAGGSFVSGGYTDTISSSFGNPLAGRMAWSGLSGGTTAAPTYISTVVNLPVVPSGQLYQLRWRVGTDDSSTASDDARVRIDTIRGLPCPPAATPTFTPSGTATNTGTATSTATFTPTPSPTATCERVADTGFEAGSPWPAWTTQTSTNFGSPLCDIATCGVGGGTANPYGGTNWAWFGGAGGVAENATAGQSVTIPAGGVASLSFQLRIGSVLTPFTDTMTVKIDGTTIDTFTEPATAEAGYTLRTYNISAFANGASHALLFSYTSPDGSSNFTVDDVSIVGCGATPTSTATPTNTSTPAATSTFTSTATATATATATGTPPSGSISGTITYGNAIGAPAGPRFVKTVTLQSTAGTPPVGPVITGTPGTYTLTGFGSGSYTIKPTKPAGPNSAITSNDAARIAQGAAGSVPFVSQNQRFTADTSGNGSVSSNDAALVARFAAGLNATLRTGQWFFFVTGAPSPLPTPPQAYNDSRTYAGPIGTLTGEDYVGLLVGEASGNWNPAIHPRGVNGPERSASVTAPQLVTPADGEVTIPIAVRGAANKEIISYEFDLRYDPAVIQPQADPVDVMGTASRGLMAVANPNEPGLLRVVMYGISPIDGNGVLMNLRFTAVGAPGTASTLVFERFMFNEGDPGTLVTDGQVELSAAAPNQAELTGRVVNTMGQGMPMARVTLTDTTGATRSAVTDSFGVYRFGNLTVGQTYTVNASSRSLKATPLAVSITSQSANIDLIAQ